MSEEFGAAINTVAHLYNLLLRWYFTGSQWHSAINLVCNADCLQTTWSTSECWHQLATLHLEIWKKKKRRERKTHFFLCLRVLPLVLAAWHGVRFCQTEKSSRLLLPAPSLGGFKSRVCVPACMLPVSSSCLSSPGHVTQTYVCPIATCIGDSDRVTDSDAQILRVCVSLCVVFLCVSNGPADPHPQAKPGRISAETYFLSVARGCMSHLVRWWMIGGKHNI